MPPGLLFPSHTCTGFISKSSGHYQSPKHSYSTHHLRPARTSSKWRSSYSSPTNVNSQRAVSVQFSSVQSLSHVQLFETPRIAARQASLSITISRRSLRLSSIESVMPSRVLPFSSCPQSLPASESFPMSQLFA